MEIYLVRHGEAAASWGEDPDPGLSAVGQQQAEGVADALERTLHGDIRIVSSPLKRALETACPLARRMALPVEQDAAFREIPAPVPLSQRQAWLRWFMRQQWGGQEPGLVAWRDTLLERLLSLEDSTVIFTHFLVINAVVGQVLGREETLWFWPDNGSITHLRRMETHLELVHQGAEMRSTVN